MILHRVRKSQNSPIIRTFSFMCRKYLGLHLRFTFLQTDSLEIVSAASLNNMILKQPRIKLFVQGAAATPSDFGIYQMTDHGKMNNQKTCQWQGSITNREASHWLWVQCICWWWVSLLGVLYLARVGLVSEPLFWSGQVWTFQSCRLLNSQGPAVRERQMTSCQRLKSRLEEAPTGQRWDNVSTKDMKPISHV